MVTPTGNAYCDALGIEVPRLEEVVGHREANFFSLLLVVLLARGAPVSLDEAARQLAEAGVGPLDRVLVSLKRCRPGRPPIYRDGNLYALDPHDDEADLWAFRLGLRPPRAAPLRLVRPAPSPLPSPDEPLTIGHLDEAWRDGVPWDWSAQRIAICVLDAHGGTMPAAEAVACARIRGARENQLSVEAADRWYRGSPIRATDGQRWVLDPDHETVRSARKALVNRLQIVRRWTETGNDPEVIAARCRQIEKRRQAHGERLARMDRVLVHAFPRREPAAIVLIDVHRREISTFLGDEPDARAAARLHQYEMIASVDVRPLLRRLGFDPGQRRLAELAPPQKSKTLDRRGRILRITNELLVRGSCGLSRPFGDEKVLRRYLRDGDHTRLRRRLEADAKSLFALYQYGRLHGAVRLRWGFLDEMIAAPWVHRDEPVLGHLMKRASELGQPLEIVAGTAPGWADPWSRAVVAFVQNDARGWHQWLVDDSGAFVDTRDVQLARLRGSGGAT
jgi:hypothetical protein